MDLREFESTAQRHPWEVARARFFRQALADAGLVEGTRRVLDAGSGDAWFARQLRADLPAAATVACWDVEYTDAQLATLGPAQPAGVTLHRERQPGPFDVVTLLDVLEHVEDDAAFLAGIVAEVRPGGHVLVSVPAWQGLYTAHDTFLHHHRRYSPAQGERLLRGAGLEIVRSGGLFHALLAPRALQKVRELVRGAPAQVASGIAWRGGRVLTAGIGAALAADNRVSRWAAAAGMGLPGLSWWALACKRSP
ncbi:MAG: methyltransferase domain-containing protein [Myxococcales bacterium]|nr:methyltransferase domain-containing protein [Myxococcales bacterium]